MNEAYGTLESVLQELDMAETESICIICNSIQRYAEKYKSVKLKELVGIIRLWGKEPLSEMLKKLQAFDEVNDDKSSNL